MQTDTYKLNRIITILIIIGYAITNVLMQIDFFGGNPIFNKYRLALDTDDAIKIGQQAYYAKTAFLLSLLILQVISGNFYRSFAWAFSIYCVIMLCFFGVVLPTIAYMFCALISLSSYYYGSYLKRKSVYVSEVA